VIKARKRESGRVVGKGVRKQVKTVSPSFEVRMGSVAID